MSLQSLWHYKEDEAKMAINMLAACLSKIAELTVHSNAAPGSIANSTSDLNGFGINEAALSTDPILHKTTPSGFDGTHKDTPLMTTSTTVCCLPTLVGITPTHPSNFLHSPRMANGSSTALTMLASTRT
jgi:hypothetical protein